MTLINVSLNDRKCHLTAFIYYISNGIVRAVLGYYLLLSDYHVQDLRTLLQLSSWFYPYRADDRRRYYWCVSGYRHS